MGPPRYITPPGINGAVGPGVSRSVLLGASVFGCGFSAGNGIELGSSGGAALVETLPWSGQKGTRHFVYTPAPTATRATSPIASESFHAKLGLQMDSQKPARAARFSRGQREAAAALDSTKAPSQLSRRFSVRLHSASSARTGRSKLRRRLSSSRQAEHCARCW